MDKEKNSKVFLFFGIVFCVITVIFVYGYINVKYNIGIPCAVNKAFGIYCPGCGLTRAGLAMLQLDFYQAFRYNAFSLIFIPGLFIVLIGVIWEYIFDKNSFIVKIPVAFWTMLFISFFAYGIIRNFIPFLQPIEI